MADATGASRPNILVFLTDDHARWASPVYGNPAVRMPHLAALAGRGTVYEDAYTPCPVCSPARASFMTGLMPSEHGIHDFLASQPRFDQQDWLAGLPTLAERLHAAGYHCGLSGKWHVARDATPQPGFDFWYALNGEYPIHHNGDNGISRDGAEERHVGNLTDVITAGARDFLARRDRQKPFFLTVGYYATHSPWTGQPQRLVDLYRDHDFAEIDDSGAPAPGIINVELEDASPATKQMARAQYYAAVTHIDEGIGAVLALLAEQGALDNTLIVYTADHGLSLGQHGIWGKGNATRPQNVLDDNIRVPLVMAGPGIAAGARLSGFTDHIGTHHRLLAAAGLQPAPPPVTDLQFCEYGTLRMVRSPTHKLLHWTTTGQRHLFRVGANADETIEITGEPAVAAELDARLTAFFAAHGDPARSGPAALAPETFNFNQAWDPFVRRPPLANAGSRS